MSNHVIKFEYSDGENLEAPLYWCGRSRSHGDWRFLDAHHVALAVGGSVQPCKSCVKAIIKELSKEL